MVDNVNYVCKYAQHIQGVDFQCPFRTLSKDKPNPEFKINDAGADNLGYLLSPTCTQTDVETYDGVAVCCTIEVEVGTDA